MSADQRERELFERGRREWELEKASGDKRLSFDEQCRLDWFISNPPMSLEEWLSRRLWEAVHPSDPDWPGLAWEDALIRDAP